MMTLEWKQRSQQTANQL